MAGRYVAVAGLLVVLLWVQRWVDSRRLRAQVPQQNQQDSATIRSHADVLRDQFGIVGDGKTDDTVALQNWIDTGNGDLRLPKGVYRLAAPLRVDLDKVGYTTIRGEGVATLRMDGSGPAIRVQGTHLKSADPGGFQDNVWQRQRMPIIEGIGIVGGHDEADGIEATGAMQLNIVNVHIRKCRHGIHLINNNRNVIIANCHIYENSGVGVFYDNVNLHQSNITGSHISYCDQGGIVSKAGNVRNIHIAGCDLESNMSDKTEPTANVLIDCRGSHYGTAEVAITGCTIQHNSKGPDSANIRIIGASDPTEKLAKIREGHVTITGNVLSDVQQNLHLQQCRGVVVSGNTFWMGYDFNVLVEDCSHVVMGANNFDRNPRYAYGTAATTKNRLVFRKCRDSTLSGLHVAAVQGAPGVLFEDCQRLNVANTTVLDCGDQGLVLKSVRNSVFTGLLLDGNGEDLIAEQCENVQLPERSN